ncbi:MAG: NUDIX hydrolase [Elusimicrobiota bacterium]
MNYNDFRKKIDDAPFPPCTVDIIIEIGGKIALIERKYPPFGWALPGGFVEKGESLEDTALREAKEETGLVLESLEQFHAYSDPDRDPRFPSISVVFTAKSSGEPVSDSDAAGVKLFPVDELPEKMAFDHIEILQDFIKSAKSGNM